MRDFKAGLLRSTRIRPLPAAVVLALLTAGLLFCGRADPDSAADVLDVPPGHLRGANLLLVTIDTLRADMLGAYGNREGLTPHLDRLARDGVRFERAFAHATTTLPSHASLLTGQYPFRHGVRDNGSFRLGASRVTLAELLRDSGYRTAAFVGAFVLDARFGLAQGFDVYEDRYGEKPRVHDFNFAERRADIVLELAREWIEGPGEGPFFAWVHLFDPHVPYDPPGPYRERFPAEPYAGEVAYTDAMLGDFLDGLRTRGKLQNTVVWVTADHGESLGEHGETTHGAFAYNATLRVPVLLSAPPVLKPQIFSSPVGHVDLTATVLDLLGLAVPSHCQGRSLLAQETPAVSPIYFEALNPYLSYHLAPLTGVVSGAYKFIDLPIPELYDLISDPRETNNLVAQEKAIAADLRADLDRLVREAGSDAATAPPQAVDAETERRLLSLGYVGAGPSPKDKKFTRDDDPKTRIRLIEDHRAAAERFAAGRSEEATALLRKVIGDRPDSIIAYLNLSTILFEKGQVRESIGTLEEAARRDPGNPTILGRLGTQLSEAGALDQALSVLRATAAKAPDDAEVLNALGVTYARLGRRDEALARFNEVLALDPTSATAHSNIGALHLEQRSHARAEASFRRALEIAPELDLAYEGLGGVFLETGRKTEAVEAWKKAVEVAPRNWSTLYNLGVLLVQLGRAREALPYLERFVAEAPRAAFADDLPRVKALMASVRAP